MTGAPVHVVGAGMAGLAAAWALAGDGRPVTLHEASPQAGGRARALPDGLDNGTHALLGANRTALRFLGAIGARHRWVEPEPQGLPVLDLPEGTLRRVALSPLGWRDPARRPPGLDGGALGALLRAAWPRAEAGGTVAAHFAAHPALLRHLVEPLTLAALNTPVAEAGLARLGAVLRRLALPGACRLLVARQGLGPDLVAPALATLRARGVGLRMGRRLRGLEIAGGRVAALAFGDGRVALPRGAAVVLALPPWEAARLLPGLPVPERHAPILNLHLALPAGTGLAPGALPRFLGVVGGVTQWALLRPGLASVTVSAAGEALRQPLPDLAAQVWAELRALAAAAGLGAWPTPLPPWRAVKEQRATPWHGPGLPAPPAPDVLPNLVLAGDWLDPVLPATLEAALRSGLRAARQVHSKS